MSTTKLTIELLVKTQLALFWYVVRDQLIFGVVPAGQAVVTAVGDYQDCSASLGGARVKVRSFNFMVDSIVLPEEHLTRLQLYRS